MCLFFRVMIDTSRSWIFTLFLIASILTMLTNNSIARRLRCTFKSRSSSRSSAWSITSRTSHEFLAIVSKFEYLRYVAIHLRSDHSDKRYYYNLNCASSNCVSNNSIFCFQRYFSRQRDLNALVFEWKINRSLNKHRTLRKRLSLQQ